MVALTGKNVQLILLEATDQEAEGALMRHTLCRTILALALILDMAGNPAILNAQQEPGALPPLTIRVSSRLVTLDVVVTNKKGEPVTDLKGEDFTVEENGKKQKVSVFIPPSGMTRTSAAPLPGILSNRPENVGPVGVPIVLLLDAANSQFKEQAYARSQMLKYVVEQGQSNRPMAVAALTDRMHVLQEFTSDPQVLTAAIKNFRPQEPILQATLAPAPSAVPADMSGPRGGGMTASLPATEREVDGFVNAQVGYNLERRTLLTIAAMRSLTRMLGGLPGRKNVVWLTAELPFDLIPENRDVTDAELMADLPNMQSKPLGTRQAGAIASEQRTLYGDDIRAVEAELTSANIAIYPVDLHGLLAGGMESSFSAAHDRDIHGAGLANSALREGGRLRTSQGTMEEVAKETGGKPYFNQNEIRQGIVLAAADDKASYEIAYYPESKKWDGKYRNIKVKIARNDVEVRYRKGYFALDTFQAKGAHYEQDVAAALEFNLPATQVSFLAQAKPTDPGKIRVVFLLDAHTLTAEESGEGRKMNVNFYAAVFGANGKNLGTRSIKVDRSFDLGTYQQILNKGMMVPLDLDVPQGADQLRLAVVDTKTGFMGTVSGPLGP